MSCGIFLWLLSNYIWMIFEFYGLYFDPFIGTTLESSSSSSSMVDYENIGRELCKYLLLCVVIMMLTFYVVLIPNGVFDRDPIIGEKHPLPSYRKRLDLTYPLCPYTCVQCCKNNNYQIYTGLHVLCWSIKDCASSWDNFELHIVALALTLLFLLDFIYREITYTLQYINLIHGIIILLWIIASGFWSIGELTIESIGPNAITDEQYRLYTFIAS